MMARVCACSIDAYDQVNSAIAEMEQKTVQSVEVSLAAGSPDALP
jgi:hypothetical protein